MSDEEETTTSGAEPAAEETPAEQARPKKSPRKKQKSEQPSDRSSDASTSWGFPRFAKDFPRHDELDALVAAFARGDYATVRERSPKLAAETDDEDVRRAARLLRERIEPDPASRLLFVITAALLVFLTAWWVAHDGPEGNGAPPPKVTPK